MRETLIVIPAREGSVRVPNKNFRDFGANGQSLVSIAERTCRQAASAMGGAQVWMLTDAERSPEARGDLPMDAVVSDLLRYEWTDLLIVQCTSPFLRAKTIVAALDVLDRHSAVKTVRWHKALRRRGFGQSQWEWGGIFSGGLVEAGGVHGITRAALMRDNTINNCPDTACIVVDEEEGFEIDTPLEFVMAQCLWQEKYG